MQDQTLIKTGAAGSVIAAICCATPLLAIVFGALGVTAWLAKADYVLIPALMFFLALFGVGLYRRRATVDACCDGASPNQEGTRR